MNRKGSRRATKAYALIALIVLVCFLAAAYVIGRTLEGRGASTERGSLEGRFEEARVVDYNGSSYRYRKRDLTTILFMGIDTSVEREVGHGFRNGGQSDFLLLLLIDNANKRVIPIHIDRDTMTEITVLSVLGNPAGTTNAQICLSHGFGDGKAQSCGFTVDAVSNLLYGVDIDFYVSVSMDSIQLINDAVGGITVTLEDDFSYYDPTMLPGSTLTLTGRQARYYVQSRMEIGVGTNESRMVRQRDYLDKLGHAIDERTRQSADFIGELFDLLGSDLQTNMKRGRMINEAWNAHSYVREAIISPSGEHIIGRDGFMEFHVDEAELEELVIGLFFEPLS